MDHVDGGCMGRMKNSGSIPLESYRENIDNARNQPVENNNIKEALMPVDQHETKYKMSHQFRGSMLIFNHENFDPSTKQDKRWGTNKDEQKIVNCFEALGFNIKIYRDLTASEINTCIWHCTTEDHNNRDCLAIFVLTHGDKDRLYAKDRWYNPADVLWGNLTSDKCPSLAGKPKLIFLQACQGKEFDDGIKLVAPPARTEFDGALRSYKLPISADLLIVYATFEGYFAFRNDQFGSMWITILCQVLKENYTKLDIQTILTHVNRKVAVEFTSVNSRDKSKDGKKQVLYMNNSRLYHFRFNRK